MTSHRAGHKEMYVSPPVHLVVVHVSGGHRNGQSQGQSQGGLWQRMSGSKAAGCLGGGGRLQPQGRPHPPRWVMATPAGVVPTRAKQQKMVLVETQF